MFDGLHQILASVHHKVEKVGDLWGKLVRAFGWAGKCSEIPHQSYCCILGQEVGKGGTVWCMQTAGQGDVESLL
jgi:hypothetical protein